MTHVYRCDGCGAELEGDRTPGGWDVFLKHDGEGKRNGFGHKCPACCKAGVVGKGELVIQWKTALPGGPTKR